MPENSPFAYSLSQVEEGWRWSVYDEDGVTVADGAHASRCAAEAAVELTLRSPLAQGAALG
ncbi:MAG: hypothetical protein ACHP9T_03320 [Caulobacterales bacterium]|jgi:hypothetical protein